MRRLVLYLLYFSVAFGSSPIWGQMRIFERIMGSATNPGSMVTCLAQDKQGYIWFGSSGRLNRYDGEEIVTYTKQANDINSLGSNRVQSIAIDSNDQIWIGTFGAGLDRFDRATNTFTHFRHSAADKGSLSNDTVTAILVDKFGNVWIGTYGGLNLFVKKTGKFIHYSYTLAITQVSAVTT